MRVKVKLAISGCREVEATVTGAQDVERVLRDTEKIKQSTIILK